MGNNVKAKAIVNIASFAILIGSQARGDATHRSDCDILLIGNQYGEKDVSKCASHGAPVNLVQIGEDVFRSWHKNGSLLLQHAFLEGILIAGNDTEWARFREEFVVQADFTSELARIRSTTDRFFEIDKFGGKFLWPLVNAHSLLKNASIFYLAQRKMYIFNKRRCIQEALGSRADLPELLSLVDFYDFSVRELDISLPFDPNDAVKSSRILCGVAQSVRSFLDETA